MPKRIADKEFILAQLRFTRGQLAYILEKAMYERRLKPRDIERYGNEMHEEVQMLRERLGALEEEAPAENLRKRIVSRPRAEERPSWIGPEEADSGNGNGSKPATKRRRRKAAAITPAAKASRQLQGRYIGALRALPKSRRSFWKKYSKQNGREAAVEGMVREMNS